MSKESLRGEKGYHLLAQLDSNAQKGKVTYFLRPLLLFEPDRSNRKLQTQLALLLEGFGHSI